MKEQTSRKHTHGPLTFDLMRKSQEAQAVRLGVSIPRKLSDEEIAPSMQALSDAECDLYGDMSIEERLGKLSPCEQRLLNEMNLKLITFRVTVTTASNTETINILAHHSCAAAIQAVDILFGEFDADKPEAFRLMVEPTRSRS